MAGAQIRRTPTRSYSDTHYISCFDYQPNDMPRRRPIRIGNVSGATGDFAGAMQRMAEEGDVDVIVGDWLSEMNIAWNAIAMHDDPSKGYENGFYEQLEDSLDAIAQRKIKVVTNAGALNTPALTDKVRKLCEERGHGHVHVASVIGDDLSELVRTGQLGDVPHLDHPEQKLRDWPHQPVCAVAYIGAWGIVRALKSGADIVICGRVTDASPVIGACAWFHGWERTDYDQLARALVAGHLVECGAYVTGANFSGFKSIVDCLVDLAFPICEVAADGSTVITKSPGHGGTVTRENTICQLLYEIQGHAYLNPDVVADLEHVRIEASGPDRVAVSGIAGSAPPSTSKVMVAGIGGYQAETTFYINGLDIQEKAEMMRRQLEHAFKDSKFSKLDITLYGSVPQDPRRQAEGTVSLRVFAQAKDKADIGEKAFKGPIYALRMQSYPGYHMNLDFRTMAPKPFMELFPGLFPADRLRHQTLLQDGTVVDVEVPPRTATVAPIQTSTKTLRPVNLDAFGSTSRAPLGSIVHARSGDKANNSNVGFFVRHADEFPWLQRLLTTDKLKELFGDDWRPASRVERCEFPGILAVHFRIMDFLDGRIASSSRVDGLGKGIGEYLRSRLVDVPEAFMSRGRI